MMRKIFRRIIRIISILAALGIAGLLLPRLVTSLHAMNHVYSAEEVSARPVAIVFGAGLWRDGTPTPILRDRVATAADLYFADKVEKLLMSGDNTTIYYNEPGAMYEYALQLGVPAEAIVLDYAGRRTYDTCYRAKAIFGVTQAILVTQDFHLPRALYICSALNLDAVGVSADRQAYRRSAVLIWNLRELFATFTALADVHILHPLPVLGKYEPIFD